MFVNLGLGEQEAVCSCADGFSGTRLGFELYLAHLLLYTQNIWSYLAQLLLYTQNIWSYLAQL